MNRALTLITLLSIGCTEQAPEEPSEARTDDPTSILSVDLGPEGGTLQHPLAYVNVPAGALGPDGGVVTLTPSDAGPQGYDTTGMAFTVGFGGETPRKEVSVGFMTQDAFADVPHLKAWTTANAKGYTAFELVTDADGVPTKDSHTRRIATDSTFFAAQTGTTYETVDPEPAEVDLVLLLDTDTSMNGTLERLEADISALLDVYDASPLGYRIAVTHMNALYPPANPEGTLTSVDSFLWASQATDDRLPLLQDLIAATAAISGEGEEQTNPYYALEGAFYDVTTGEVTSLHRTDAAIEFLLVTNKDYNSGGADYVRDQLERLLSSPDYLQGHGILGPDEVRSGGCSRSHVNAEGAKALHRSLQLFGGRAEDICASSYTQALTAIASSTRATACTPLAFPAESDSHKVTVTGSGDTLDTGLLRVESSGCVVLNAGAYHLAGDRELAVRYDIILP